MGQHIAAIFENGVFRPEAPVNIANGQRVSLNIESGSDHADDLSDVGDLLDAEYLDQCHQNAGLAPSLEEVHRMLSVFQGSLADRIAEERDD